ncbi:MAG: glycosyltransferase family 39 protein, partial [Acidobacteria bacterium]|nr:glycosyltransferase family 39 protein [Acidobacteriota bacterium]
MTLYGMFLLLVFILSGICLYISLFSSRQQGEGFISGLAIIILLPLSLFILLGSLLGMIGIYRTDISLFSIFIISIAFIFRKVDKQFLNSGFKKIGNYSLAIFKDWKRFVALFLMLILLVFVLAIYFRPAAYYLGGFDPGIYVNSGINLAKGGSVFFHDEVVRDLGFEKARRYLGMFSINPLGLNITKQFDGAMASQFYPGMSVLYAGSYDILGFNSFLGVQPFIALFALLALFLFTKKIFGFPTAFIATLLYGINIITIWFGRYPVSEPLTVLLLGGSFYIFIRFIETEDSLFSAWGGLLGAAALMTRPDAAVAIVVMFAYGYYRKFFDLTLKKEWLYYATLFAGLLFSFVYAFFFTGGYMHGVFLSFLGVSLRKENALLKASLMVCLLLIAAFLAWKIIDKRKEIRKWLGKLNLPMRFLPTVLAGLVLALIIFQLMIRPARPFAFLSPQDNSLLRLGWYFAPLGLGWEYLQTLSPLL